MKKIIFKGIRTNNLKNLDISITPKSLVCICGCSGSGKSSLAFDTIHAVSKNEIGALINDDCQNANYEVDFYDNILFSVALKQLNFNINPRSSILSYFHLSNELSLILSKISTDYTKNAIFLSPKNLCPKCSGLGFIKEIDISKIIDKNVKIKDNPFLPWQNSYKDFYTKILNLYINDMDINADLKFYELCNEIQEMLLYKTSAKKYKINYKIATKSRVKTAFYKGIMLDNKIADQYLKSVVCQDCGGTKLKDNINNTKILNYTLRDILLCNFYDLESVLNSFRQTNRYINTELEKLCLFVKKCISLGIGHLNFSRSIPSLSGGELQRLRIVKILLGKINNIMIILDEPTSSLHPSEVLGLSDEIENLKINNTVIVIEHNKELIKKADDVIYIGLKSGKYGGNLISKQDYENEQKFSLNKVEFLGKNTQQVKLKSLEFLKFQGKLIIKYNSLIGVSARSGAGKTSLLKYILSEQLSSYIYISQKPIKANINSTIATYTDIMDDMKQLFLGGLLKNKNTMCKKCGGSGRILILERYQNTVYEKCVSCDGSGYSTNILKIKIFDMNICEILTKSIGELQELDFSKKVSKKISLLNELGLSHLSLNRTILNISGGEQQRLKLFKALFDKKNKIFGLDEPTKGLNNSDTLKIISLLYKQIQKENKTFIVAEHNPLFLSYCSEMIELKRDANVVKVIFNAKTNKIKNCKESQIANFIN